MKVPLHVDIIDGRRGARQHFLHESNDPLDLLLSGRLSVKFD